MYSTYSRYKKKNTQHSNNKHYRVCFAFVKNVECFNAEKCKFAHSLDEFTPKICRYDSDCKGVVKCEFCKHNILTLNNIDNCECVNECTKLHPSFENKLQLLNRIGLYPSHIQTD